MPRPRRQSRPPTPIDPTPTPRPTTPAPDLRRLLLNHLNNLKIAPVGQTLDALLTQAEQEGWSHLEFAIICSAALANLEDTSGPSKASYLRGGLRQETCLLEQFDWNFERTIHRPQIEELATGDFVRRKCNLVMAGHSGVGKALAEGIAGCMQCTARASAHQCGAVDQTGCASLADQTLPQKDPRMANYDPLVIDEFGFNRIERQEHPESANSLYKVLDARNQKRSTALATNVDFDAQRLPRRLPLAMASPDRLVDRAINAKIKGKSPPIKNPNLS